MTKKNSLHLMRWPVDISVFGLSISYGFTHILDKIFDQETPDTALYLAYGAITFVTTYIVRRYLPSEGEYQQFGKLAVSLWLNFSLFLSIIVPWIGIFLSDHLVFAVLLFAAVSAKAVITMEEKVLGEKRLTAKSSVIFEQTPGAYALRTFPTAILFTLMAIGLNGLIHDLLRSVSHQVKDSNIPFEMNWWTIIACAGVLPYIILSGISRIRAFDRRS